MKLTFLLYFVIINPTLVWAGDRYSCADVKQGVYTYSENYLNVTTTNTFSECRQQCQQIEKCYSWTWSFSYFNSSKFDLSLSNSGLYILN